MRKHTDKKCSNKELFNEYIDWRNLHLALSKYAKHNR